MTDEETVPLPPGPARERRSYVDSIAVLEALEANALTMTRESLLRVNEVLGPIGADPDRATDVICVIAGSLSGAVSEMLGADAHPADPIRDSLREHDAGSN